MTKEDRQYEHGPNLIIELPANPPRGRSIMPSWTCEICGQVVELPDDDSRRWPLKVYENCRLQHHYVDNACIGYAQPEVAKELIRMAKTVTVSPGGREVAP
jgi:hypothetical protein